MHIILSREAKESLKDYGVSESLFLRDVQPLILEIVDGKASSSVLFQVTFFGKQLLLMVHQEDEFCEVSHISEQFLLTKKGG